VDHAVIEADLDQASLLLVWGGRARRVADDGLDSLGFGHHWQFFRAALLRSPL